MITKSNNNIALAIDEEDPNIEQENEAGEEFRRDNASENNDQLPENNILRQEEIDMHIGIEEEPEQN